MNDNNQPELFPDLAPIQRVIDLFGEAMKVKHGKHYIAPRGGADRPGTGPAGETCGSCKHLYRHHPGNRNYLKCALMRSIWTGGAKTDIRAGWAACSKWEKPE